MASAHTTEKAGPAAEVEAIEGVVIDPDLIFTTPERERTEVPEAERSLGFQIDGATYTIIRPEKLPEALSGLIEAGARRATEADALFAGAAFLRKVIAPESLARLEARINDDKDAFTLVDLFDCMEKIAIKLIKMSPAAAPTTGPVPARRRSVR